MHRNDMENINPFFVLGAIYCVTAGQDSTRILIGKWLFRVFFGARVVTSVCHYFAIQVGITVTDC